MMIKVKCRKCLEETMMDIGDMSKEQVVKALSNDVYGFNCFGGHCEFGNRIDYWELDWKSMQEGSAPTEEDFVANLKSKYSEVYDTDELQQHYSVISFSYGACVTRSKADESEKVFDFVQSPKGRRYYIA